MDGAARAPPLTAGAGLVCLRDHASHQQDLLLAPQSRGLPAVRPYAPERARLELVDVHHKIGIIVRLGGLLLEICRQAPPRWCSAAGCCFTSSICGAASPREAAHLRRNALISVMGTIF